MEKAIAIEKDVLQSPSESKSELGNGLQWTEEEETILRHKMDWRTVPWVTVLYLLCFLDRINIGNARIQGMQQDLQLEGLRFNWALSIFYIVYLTVEVPSNIILKRVGPRYYLPSLVVGFGLVSMCSAFIQSYGGLLAARAVLGVFEGGAMPGFAFYLSSFYKRKELLFRIGIYVSAASMAGAFGGLLATGLSRIPDWGGIITMIIGLIAPIWLPGSPASCMFLTDRERMIATERLVREHRSQPDEKVTLAHVKRAVTNIHNYTCGLGFFLINITVQGLSVFLPTILRDLDWTDTKAQLYSVPPYVCACVVAVAIAYASDKTRHRGAFLAAFSLLAIIGFAILRWETNPNIRYMGVFFVTVGAFPGGPGFLAWAINNAAGPAVRAVTSAYVVTVGTIGGIVATWTYIPADGPAYRTGHTINLVGQIVVVCLSLFGIAYCSWENKLRAAGKRDHRLEGRTQEEIDQLGYRHPEFRYIK
ncbi:hypothetical protein KVR01_008271 [Diaporthe batatas]|uniref:uncharacterized protein n=1 Tax=Diaporthe batatas TaxID=748121 RepID=UPI001D0389C1|nr:uncharacterized protein KVR01_008271 [Diaporthe batatas]KAG8162506.1 hypothetical protein KVR01_008271 [Diaporthe batatas]